MTQELIRERTKRFGKARSLVSSLPWHALVLGAILVLSAFLNLHGLTGEGHPNSYYSAAVKNMLTSWSNFFFVSFDAGFVSVDKPPLGLWIQAASAWLFGFSALALVLPQAIAGVLSVAVLYHLVRRTFGPVAGLLSALALAVTPIMIVTSRNNTMDMLVVLFVLLAAWAFLVAAERGSLGLLMLGAAIVGLGFNTKTLQAFLVLPAFYLLYLLAARVPWRRRFLHLVAATVVLVAVSLSWALAVDLTPSGQRPYVGGSEGDSALNLAFGYNGLERLLGRSEGPGGPPVGGGKADDGKAAEKSPDAREKDGGGAPKRGPGGGGGPGGVGENGEPGPLRLVNQQLAGQIGWLLPLAVVGLLAAGSQRFPRLPLGSRHAALVMWGAWLLTAAAYFSVSGYGHRHYLVMLAPAVAALVGIGATALWRDYRSPGRRGWLLPLVLVGTAAVQAYVLSDYAVWRAWLIPWVAGLCLVAAAVLALVRLRPSTRVRGYVVGAATTGVLALLIAPASWAAYASLSLQGGGPTPAAGPQPIEAEGGPGRPGGPTGGPGGGSPRGGGPGGPGGREADPVLLEYLQANKGGAAYLVAGPSSMPLSPIILGTDEKVINLGGFMGRDPVLSYGELTDLVDEGAVRFFLVQDRERMEEMRAEMEAEQEASGGSAPQGPPPGGPPGADNEAVIWVQDNCEKVPQELWQSPEEDEEQRGGGPGGPGGPGRAQALYDCGAEGGR
jgi:4-amino-4-deoxy-L-arabinose transferase-like glycosyltransferase